MILRHSVGGLSIPIQSCGCISRLRHVIGVAKSIQQAYRTVVTAANGMILSLRLMAALTTFRRNG